MRLANFPFLGSDEVFPLPASALFRELSSAAVDAELARLARSWRLGEMEKIVGSFKPAESPRGARKKAFHALRAGSRLQEGHASRIQAAFPRSNVYLWWSHPLASVLCDPSLGLDDLVAHLKQLPAGRVRACVWSITYVPTCGFATEALVPWSHGLIESLQRERSPMALFALIARYRIEQLSGGLTLGLDAANSAWSLLAHSVARSRSLLIAKDALVAAMDYFLSWQPFADARLWELANSRVGLRRREALVKAETTWAGESAIPRDILEARRHHLTDAVRPGIAYLGTWWGFLYSDLS